jgi:DNA-binding NtrC family response regulator
VIQLDLPPLRERGDDVLLLAQHFIPSFSNRLRRRKIGGLSPEVVRAFKLYDWPGNVRELRNVIERAITLEDGDLITTRYLARDIASDTTMAESGFSESAKAVEQNAAMLLPHEGISLDLVEKSFLKQALARSGGNQTRAAELLGITRDKLRYRLKKHDEMNHARH